MVQFSRSKVSESDNERVSPAKKVVVVVLCVMSMIVIAHTVQSYRYVTPEWVALRETRVQDEFYLKNFSDIYDFTGSNKRLHTPRDKSGLKDKLNFTAPSIDDYHAVMEPIWECNDPSALEGRKKKLIFVHSFRTAGSTVKALLQGYAKMCHAGAALVVFCQSVSWQSLTQGNWVNGDGYRRRGQCQMRRALSRDGTEVEGMGLFNSSFLEANIDTLAGNLPLGIESGWKTEEGKMVDTQYVAFFRDPVHKYVSGTLYNRRGLTINETVKMIKKRVNDAVDENNFYDKSSSYLITPAQKAVFDKYGFGLSNEESASLAMANLVQKNALVGIVERMSESLEMLQHIIDEEGVTDPMFVYFGKKDANGTIRDVRVNQSPISTAEVVAEMEKDEPYMKVMRDYLKWEDKVYKFALGMHMRQFEYIQSQKVKTGIV